MTAPQKPGFHSDDATLAPHGDTLRPDEAPAPNDTAHPNDATLVPPPAGTHRTEPPPAPRGAAHEALTLPQPPSPPKPARAIAETVEVDQPPLAPPPPAPRPVGAAPDDATLDPNDPQAQEYQEAVAKTGHAVGTGASFGDYQLIEPIAKGGMGIVYKARQRKLNRVVAVKMILAGQFADRTDVDRFYAEAEAAAALTHPNIVAIHEIGEVSGQHFFSMDYIEGQSLAGMVRDSTFTPPQAAEYVRVIAETMQFAHERGIVHRDLKPSNILVDKQLRPLITDFGLAKQVSNQSQLTMSGAIVGTPSYMPPEQAAGDGDRVGPRSDIYSLGAILYELLTGRPPFRAASPFETVRQVIENDPLSPRLVNPGVPKDLETICLKCLQKDPAKRYDTSQDLAAELQRFIVGEPIHARPVGKAERIWRWCKRNPYLATAISAAVACLCLATVGLVVAYVNALKTLSLEQEKVALTESSFLKQKGVVDDLFTRVSEETLLNQPGMQPLRKDLMEKVLAYYQQFLAERGNDVKLKDELASTHYRIGVITEMLESADKALPFYETADKMQTELLLTSPDDPQRIEARANTLNALGTVWAKKKDSSRAGRQFSAAAALRERLVKLREANVDFKRMLANVYLNLGQVAMNSGDLPAAREHFRKSQEIRQAALKNDPKDFKVRRDIGKGFYGFGNLNWQAGDVIAAEKDYRQAIDMFEQLSHDNPADLDNNLLLAVSQRLLGDLKASTNEPEAAREAYDLSQRRLESLARRNPAVLDYQFERARVFMNLGDFEVGQERSLPAIAAFQQAVDILRSLADDYPLFPQYQRELAAALRELGAERAMLAEFNESLTNLKEAHQIVARLVTRYAAEREYNIQLAVTLRQLAAVQFDSGNKPDALQSIAQSQKILLDLLKPAPDDPVLQAQLESTKQMNAMFQTTPPGASGQN
jgi:serine/threonine-protein kinase